MDHAEIEEHQVVDCYLQSKLSEDDTERFEKHYLGCQQCLDELELAERMQGAARTAASEDAARLTTTRGLAVFAWLARRGPVAQWAVMAVLVLLPGLALLRQVNPRPQEGGPPVPVTRPLADPQPGTLIVPLRPERGGPEATAPSLQLDLPSPPRWLVFSVEVEPSLDATYRVVLRRGAEESELWRAENLEPDASGLLNISFHSSFFEDGDHLLVVDAVIPEGGSVPIGRHAFRVVRTPS